MQMIKLNLTLFGQRRKLSYYLRLKITLNILDVSYTKESVAVKIITLMKP